MQFLEQNLKPNYCSVFTRSKRSYEFSITSYGKKPKCSFWAISITCCQIYSLIGKIFIGILLNARKYSRLLCVFAKSLLTLCDPIECSPPGSSFHGILQAKILEWVAMPFSRGSSQLSDWTCISYISLHWQADSFTTGATWETLSFYEISINRTKFLVIKDYILKEG